MSGSFEPFEPLVGIDFINTGSFQDTSTQYVVDYPAGALARSFFVSLLNNLQLRGYDVEYKESRSWLSSVYSVRCNMPCHQFIQEKCKVYNEQ